MGTGEAGDDPGAFAGYVLDTFRDKGAPQMSDEETQKRTSEGPREGGVSLLKRRLLSGGAWAFGGRVATAVAILASNALLARLLSPQNLGGFFLASSLVSVGSLLGSLGLTHAVVRFVAESIGKGQYERARGAIFKILGLGLLGATGVGIAYLLLGRAIGSGVFGAPALGAVTALVAAWIAVMTLQTILAEVFRGFHDIRLATIFGGALTWLLVTAGLGLMWLISGRATLAGTVSLAAVSGLASVVVACFLLLRKIGDLPAKPGPRGRVGFWEILIVAGPILVTNLTLFVSSEAGLWVVGAFRPQEDVALYGAAVRLSLLVAMPLVIVNAVVPPLIAEMYSQGRRRELERTLRTISTVSGVPAALALSGFIVLGGPILGLVFGDYYRPAAVVLALLSTAFLVDVWAGAAGMTLMMTGHQNVMMKICVSCGVLSVVLGFLLVGRFGPTGVAVSTTVSVILQSVLMVLWAKRVTGIWTHAGPRYLVRLTRWRNASGEREVRA